MAAKVGLASVSYGIGVQNRYSAFLDDEDGFGAPTVNIANGASKHLHQQLHHQQQQQQQQQHILNNKQKNLANNSGVHQNLKSSQSISLTGKVNGRVISNNKQQEQQQQPRGGQITAGDLSQKRSDNRRPKSNQQQQQHQQSVNNNLQAPRQAAFNNKQGNSNQDNTAINSNRFARTQPNISNQHHQSHVSHHQQQTNSPNKENNELSQQQQHQGKLARNGTSQRAGRRSFHGEDKKPGQHLEDGHSNSFGTGIPVQSNEEEKRRRQQKRALDLKHKDPEKREARRQQTVTNEHTNQGNQPVDQAQGENNTALRGQRNRRQASDGTKNQDDASRGFKGPGGNRNRGRREPGNSDVNNGERREGQPAGGRNNRGGDRPARNRNGFGAGSRGSRNSKSDDQGKFNRDSERQKPIPNFSDKLDFPSLAS